MTLNINNTSVTNIATITTVKLIILKLWEADSSYNLTVKQQSIVVSSRRPSTELVVVVVAAVVVVDVVAAVVVVVVVAAIIFIVFVYIFWVSLRVFDDHLDILVILSIFTY